jgi:hypothetical protein
MLSEGLQWVKSAINGRAACPDFWDSRGFIQQSTKLNCDQSKRSRKRHGEAERPELLARADEMIY